MAAARQREHGWQGSGLTTCGWGGSCSSTRTSPPTPTTPRTPPTPSSPPSRHSTTRAEASAGQGRFAAAAEPRTPRDLGAVAGLLRAADVRRAAAVGARQSQAHTLPKRIRLLDTTLAAFQQAYPGQALASSLSRGRLRPALHPFAAPPPSAPAGALLRPLAPAPDPQSSSTPRLAPLARRRALAPVEEGGGPGAGLCTSALKPRPAHRYPAEVFPKELYLGDWKHAEVAYRLGKTRNGARSEVARWRLEKWRAGS